MKSLCLLFFATAASALRIHAARPARTPPPRAGAIFATAAPPAVSAPPADEAALLSLLGGSGDDGRGASLAAPDAAEVHRLSSRLEASVPPGSDTNDSPLLPGRWRVLYQVRV